MPEFARFLHDCRNVNEIKLNFSTYVLYAPSEPLAKTRNCFRPNLKTNETPRNIWQTKQQQRPQEQQPLTGCQGLV